MSNPALFVWSIAAVAIAGVLVRPRNWPEAIWACLGAVVMVVCGFVPASQAVQAIAKGTDVYLFLTGMMLLAELARRQGVFDWLASVAVTAAKGSRARLFTLIYTVGTLVTIFLSNDATAVVLTPAVYAAVQKARAKPLPYLYICAFIANAASFVLPISNPANLVVYGKQIPPLVPWLRIFLLPSVVSIAITYFALHWISRKDLSGNTEVSNETATLSREGQVAAWAIVGTGVILLCASGFGLDLGLPTLIAAAIAVCIATRVKGRALVEIGRHISWSILPLVAGLFVLVEGLNRAGARELVGNMLLWCEHRERFAGSLAASFGIAVLSNVMNNLPSGLLAGGALQAMQVSSNIRNAVLVGVDLGPNLSVTGSLATILWLIALRREGERISGWRFLQAGALVMFPALLLATIAVAL